MILILGIILSFILFRVSYMIKGEYKSLTVWLLGFYSTMIGMDLQFNPDGVKEFLLMLLAIFITLPVNILVKVYLVYKENK